MHLLVDELRAAEVLPLHLPLSTDARLRQVCEALMREPADTATAEHWAQRLGVSAKTLQRLFVKDRKSTRLNSSHLVISYAVFCLKKKKTLDTHTLQPVTPLY